MWSRAMDFDSHRPSDARLLSMARLLIRADQEDEEWVYELLRATRNLSGRDRDRLQTKLSEIQTIPAMPACP